MKANIRAAIPSDAHRVAVLIRAYAREVFSVEATVSAEALLDDGFGSVLEFLVVEAVGGEVVGFAAWEKTYDVIAGTRGGAVLGMYIEPPLRGQGTGDALLAAVTREIRAIGGRFLAGLGQERPSDAVAISERVPTRVENTSWLIAADLTEAPPHSAL